MGDQAIRSKALTRSIETAQKKVEGNNYDIRKTLLDYDNVLNEQREIIYNKRNEILDEESIHDSILVVFRNTITNLIESHYDENGHMSDESKKELLEYVNANYLKNSNLQLKDVLKLEDEELRDTLYDLIVKDYEKKMIDSPLMNEFEKAISLRIIDSNWVEHMSAMEHLKEGIGLRGYSQTNPIQAYTMEGFEMFDQFLIKIDDLTSQFLLKSEIKQNTERKQTLKGNANDGKEKVKAQPKRNTTKVGRNDPCPCGSGKKYKQCCGK
jgi:preprotein translocase subunit SecA